MIPNTVSGEQIENLRAQVKALQPRQRAAGSEIIDAIADVVRERLAQGCTIVQVVDHLKTMGVPLGRKRLYRAVRNLSPRAKRDERKKKRVARPPAQGDGGSAERREQSHKSGTSTVNHRANAAFLNQKL